MVGWLYNIVFELVPPGFKGSIFRAPSSTVGSLIPDGDTVDVTPGGGAAIKGADVIIGVNTGESLRSVVLSAAPVSPAELD